MRRRLLTLVVTIGLLGGGAVVGGRDAAAQAPDTPRPVLPPGVPPQPGTLPNYPSPVPLTAVPSGPVNVVRAPEQPIALGLTPEEAARLPKAPTFAPVRTELDVPRAGLSRAGDLPVSVGRPVRVEGDPTVTEAVVRPVESGAQPPVPDVAQVPDRVAVKGHGREVVESVGSKTGIQGLLFEVGRADVGRGNSKVSVSLDYSAWIRVYGPEWATRVRILRFPQCVLSEPDNEACNTPVVMPFANDVKNSSLMANLDVSDVIDGAGGGRSVFPSFVDPPPQWVYGVSTSVSGPNGNWGASGPPAEGEFGTTGNTGAFTWSYPIPAMPAVAGWQPSLGVAYNSASVDGINNNKSSQGSDAGLGWELTGLGAIERRYENCSDDGGTATDLCWSNESISISLPGASGTLVAVSPGSAEYRLSDDSGWRFVRTVRGAAIGGNPNPFWQNSSWSPAPNWSVGNGIIDNDGEFWAAYSPDGTAYYFGLGSEPTSGAYTDSVWTVPVRGNHPGEPCYGTICSQGWKWNLDRVIDKSGNVATVFYNPAINSYNAYPHGRVSVRVRWVLEPDRVQQTRIRRRSRSDATDHVHLQPPGLGGLPA